MKYFEAYLRILRLTQAFFLGLVKLKSATTATSIKAAGDWNGLLEHNIIGPDILTKSDWTPTLVIAIDENDKHWKSVLT